jgi:dienelactone hydrolase
MTYLLQRLHQQGIPPLLEGVAGPRAWAAKRSQICEAWLATVGGLPERVDPVCQVLSTTEMGDHTRQQIRYATAGGDEVPALLLIPKGLSRPAAAVLALHPTANEGKRDVATPEGRENRRYGLELVQRGYVVLAPDTITAGERVYPGCEPYRTAPFDQANPGWSAVGKMLTDHQHGLDLLCRLEAVDPGRIGAIGHSLGAYNAFFLAGLDSRIAAVVSSCGLSTFAGDTETHRWGRREWFSHLPALDDQIAQGEVPFEFHEIAALAAPTPFFNWSGQSDRIFPHWKPIAEASLDLSRLYEFLGAKDRYVGLLGSGGHDFPPAIRAMAYAFLDRWLRGQA